MPVSISTSQMIDVDFPEQFGLDKEDRLIFASRTKDGGTTVIRIAMSLEHRLKLSEILREPKKPEQ